MHARIPAPLIAFSSPTFEDVALNELGGLLGTRPRTRLAPGAWLLECPLPASEVAARVYAAPPIFTRQMVLDVVSQALNLDPRATALAALDLPAAHDASAVWLFDPTGHTPAHLDPLRAAVTQVWHDRGSPGHGPPLALIPSEHSIFAGSLLPGAGLPLRAPTATQSPVWPAGRPDLPYVPNLVSRSALKLLEALTVFAMPLDPDYPALDLGAAPGGWTQILTRHGLAVVAVDPGDLDPRAAALTTVTIHRTTAQHYLRHADRSFGLIVNDMRLDARESARITVDAAGLLASGGAALVTLKLLEHTPTPALRAALEILRRRIPHLRARCLYFNRNEVTVYLPTAQALPSPSFAE